MPTEASWGAVDITPSLGIGSFRVWMVRTAATAHDAYTVTLTPATYGKIININGCDMTNGTVEDAAWAPSTGVITIGGSANIAARTYVVTTLR